MTRFKCRKCGKTFDLEGMAPGDSARCPNCGAPVRGTTEVAAAAAPQRQSEAGERLSAAGHASIKPGDVLRGFRIENMIAAGGMAAVYRALQLSLSRPVALKILSTEYADTPSFVEQFDSEMASLASLNHPNIVSIIDKGREGDTYFFAMEYVDGTTLAELVQSSRITAEFFVKIFTECTRALRYAHTKGIIHRDIKPSNIMLDQQSNAKLADFGLAGLISSGRPKGNADITVMGTPGFMAPEQFRGISNTDARSDIFSLGAVMYQMLTGTLPGKLPLPAPSQLSPEVDPRLDHLVLKCLEVEPGQRYQSAGELLSALESYRQEITRVAEVCPNCMSENPVTARACLKCGADLSALFDVCPECNVENRRDVEVCLACGTNLRYLRAQITVLINKRRERALELCEAEKYGEAVKVLERILQVKGKVFEHSRAQARDLIREYQARLRQQSRQALGQGRALAAEGKLAEAVRTWRRIPVGAVKEVDLAQVIRDTESKMSEARAGVGSAKELMDRYVCDEAATVPDAVASAWPHCPGLAEARNRLQKLQQTEQVIGYELKQADRLLAEGDCAGARKAMGFLCTSLPDHPRVKEKLLEVALKEKRLHLAGIVAQAESLQQQEHYEMAGRKWEEAAAMFADASPRKAGFLEKAAAARQLAEAAASAKGQRKRGRPAASPGTKGDSTTKRGRRKGLLLVLLAVAAAIVIAIALAVWLGGAAFPAEGPPPVSSPSE